MNNLIISQIVKLNEYYQNELVSFNQQQNEYLMYEFDQENYFEPFIEFIVPNLKKHLYENVEDDFSTYHEHILDKFKKSITINIIHSKLNSDFLEKLSLDITTDFNMLLTPYSKMEVNLQNNFISQFIKNKKKALFMMAENNPELAIKTIANLRNPKLQYYLINRLDVNFQEKIRVFLEAIDEYEFKTIMKETMSYPKEITPREYIELWKGESTIHIKFCRDLIGSRYEEAKSFIKAKEKTKVNVLKL